jgi:translation initiation factor 2 beta subunit (eIF-2beta)/eIF-5
MTRETLVEGPVAMVACPVCHSRQPADRLHTDRSMTLQCNRCQARVRYRIAANGRIFTTIDHESKEP